ncbi:response regulator transcription factor [Aestuariicella hydrocarbonica]|uniref:Response regulator transcription factor n=1 Tax=Pseudomaricurvus hydrocarbonicus TaxID=1470433 RepID=A0A9E5JTU0_9GAMM|nr:response regulator [Aestuariicella hydrocarbonica]NHO65179.1 response regulator transcription factor [Aestuariicella hydrocarbonica]
MAAAPSEFVYVIDNDAGVRSGLVDTLIAEGLAVKTYDSGKACIDALSTDSQGCMILDLNMPGINGLQLQELLNDRSIHLPIIYVSGQAKVSAAVEAMKKGAIEFLEKPLDPDQLLRAVYRALEIGRENRQRHQQLSKTRQRIDSLSKRELQVMNLLVTGDATKVIADKLNISPRTVEVHRHHIMTKMNTRTLAQLVQMVMQVRGS